ncbi:LysM peptidoglycan-binding domain-containing protein [Chengkuizengella axinellae]|uniref:LysM peptidoglycan-binding domain-containing protein n=1 Tax=Chengkuizengella axinellae TaxID=3064388 RepID=A0ABT9ITT2_9BACL|nr:LysM peptidoglycan-binding domain-containing protein [Chengkuizengella sp. 2205SS18-9]MDP5272713.1 LysM peptidoglycan-binding domain-containing protein [Chengkuizengella sp. 2205SS18-9]
MNDQPKGLRFDIFERVHLPEDIEGIQDLDDIELIPDIHLETRGDQANLVGKLILSGQYVGIRNKNNKRILEHFIPVDITLPLNRIHSLEEIGVEIENFDIDLLSTRNLNVSGVLSLVGIEVQSNQDEHWNNVEETVFVHHANEDKPEWSGETAEPFLQETTAQNFNPMSAKGDVPNFVTPRKEEEPVVEMAEVEVEQPIEKVEKVKAAEKKEEPVKEVKEAIKELVKEKSKEKPVAEKKVEMKIELKKETKVEPKEAAKKKEKVNDVASEEINDKVNEDVEEKVKKVEEKSKIPNPIKPLLEKIGKGSGKNRKELEAVEEIEEPVVEPKTEMKEEIIKEIKEAPKEKKPVSEKKIEMKIEMKKEVKKDLKEAKEEVKEELKEEPEKKTIKSKLKKAEKQKVAEEVQDEVEAVEESTNVEAVEETEENILQEEETKPSKFKLAFSSKKSSNQESSDNQFVNKFKKLLHKKDKQENSDENRSTTEIAEADTDAADVREDGLEWKKLFLAEEEEVQKFKKVRMCIVQKEETIETIAARYELNPREILLYNRFDNQVEVHAGQVIYIPQKK